MAVATAGAEMAVATAVAKEVGMAAALEAVTVAEMARASHQGCMLWLLSGSSEHEGRCSQLD